MRIRKPISRESGEGLLRAAGHDMPVRYELITWGTFEGDELCIRERHGALEGADSWFSGVAELRLESGEQRRILLRKSGTFAMCE